MTAVLLVASSGTVWNLRVIALVIGLLALLGPLSAAVSHLPRWRRRLVAFVMAALVGFAMTSHGGGIFVVRQRPALVLMACQDWMWPFCQSEP